MKVHRVLAGVSVWCVTMVLLVCGCRTTGSRRQQLATEATLRSHPTAAAEATPYREFVLIPVGGTGPPNSYSQTPTGKIRGEPDVAAIRDSDLYRGLSDLRAALDAGERVSGQRDANTILEVRADYTFADDAGQYHLEVTRWRPALPLAVPLPVPGGILRFGAGLIGSAHAIWYEDQSNQPPDNQLWFIEAGMLTQMEGNSSLSRLRQLARILVQ